MLRICRGGFSVTRVELDEVVQTNDKQRFALSVDGKLIRANQGHSVTVDLGLTPEIPPPKLYHGSVERFVSSIMADGLEKRARQHVHLSVDVDTANRVGSRRGRPIILEIAAEKMHQAGFLFFRSQNGGLAHRSSSTAIHFQSWLNLTLPGSFSGFHPEKA